MALRNPSPRLAPVRRKVLTKAVIRAARALAINQSKVAATLGVSDPTVSRMFAEKYLLDPARKEWELGALFVRLFRSLDSVRIRVLLYLDSARGQGSLPVLSPPRARPKALP